VPLLATLALAALPCWAPPVDAPVLDPFRPPACTWCPGNRGIEYAAAADDTVRAVASGTVRFAGTVAGVRWVVIEHADGLRASYGRLRDTPLRPGARVLAGGVVGAAGADALYFGLREPASIGDAPVDPTPMLGVPRRPPRLVPVDGSPAAPARAARAVCPKPAAHR